MRRFLAFVFLALAALPAAYAQRDYTQPELERILAPVALYPDALLSQVLAAAVHPDQVAVAARWSRANPGLRGEDAVQAVQEEPWDPSVISLVAFPEVLSRLAQNPEWTRQLGEAFQHRQPHLMDAVQVLRQRAQAAGQLQSGGGVVVQQQGATLTVEPADPRVVYIPVYDPVLVYAAGPPVIHWVRPVYVRSGFFYSTFNWHRRHVHQHHARPFYYHQRPAARWQWQPHSAQPIVSSARPQTPVQIQQQLGAPAAQVGRPAQVPAQVRQPEPQRREHHREHRREHRHERRHEQRQQGAPRDNRRG